MNYKSTYSLLLNAAAEEKGRSIFETSIYAIVVLCMALSGWHFASSTVTLPGEKRADKPFERVIANSPEAAAPIVLAQN